MEILVMLCKEKGHKKNKLQAHRSVRYSGHLDGSVIVVSESYIGSHCFMIQSFRSFLNLG